MVGAGLGTTFLPQMAIDAGILDNTDLVAIPLPGEKPYREIGLVWRPSTTRVQTFYKIAELLTPLITPNRRGDQWLPPQAATRQCRCHSGSGRIIVYDEPRALSRS
jgi:DNA-binding transcriptional LysR family regulator